MSTKSLTFDTHVRKEEHGTEPGYFGFECNSSTRTPVTLILVRVFCAIYGTGLLPEGDSETDEFEDRCTDLRVLSTCIAEGAGEMGLDSPLHSSSCTKATWQLPPSK